MSIAHVGRARGRGATVGGERARAVSARRKWAVYYITGLVHATLYIYSNSYRCSENAAYFQSVGK